MAGFGAGWHVFLEALDSALFGTPDDSDYMALCAEYRKRFGTVAG